MNEQQIETLQAARGLSRRASFLTIGATGLVALASPLAAEARKKKRCKKKDKKCPSLEEICAPQVEDCLAIVAAVCGTDPGCDRLIDCCEVFETCDVGAFVLCLGTPPPTET
jgi:hypothetical protein